MNERAILVVLVCLPLFSGRCGPKSHEPDARVETGDATLVVSGEVHHSERILLPPGATLVVAAEDAATGAGAWETVGPLSGSPPYPFALSIDEAELKARGDVVLRAEILVDGERVFASTEPEPAFEGGAPRDDVSLLVVPVPSAAE